MQVEHDYSEEEKDIEYVCNNLIYFRIIGINLPLCMFV